jgi:hypothetical protein
MNIKRVRALAIWITASLALLSVVYAPRENLEWSRESQAWKRSQLGPTERSMDFIWIIPDDFDAEALAQGFKAVPDWPRIGGELLLIVFVGGGLIYALRDDKAG